MATYYWVGGAGPWNSTSTTNWASSSGGAGGAGFPTILDDVVFDTSSGTGVVGVTASYAFCRDFTVTASQALTFSSGILAGVAGDISLPSGGSVGINNLGIVCIANSAKTITTNGKTLSSINFNGINGSWTLQSALTMGGTLTLIAGTFNTNNQTVTCNAFSSLTSNTRALNLGSSTVSINGNWSSSIGFTLNAGTSTINFLGNFSVVDTGANSLTFNNVGFTTTSNLTTHQILTSNTFNNLTLNGPSTNSVWSISFGANQTINGTFTASGATPTRRVALYSMVVGAQRTLTVNAWSASPAYLDFRDIAITGAVGTLSGTSFGDCNNNSGITFTAPKTVYWNLAGSQNWSATGWATTSGGTPNSANFPLAQDTCVFDNAGAIGTVSIESFWNIGTIDTSTRSSAATLTVSTSISPNIYGDVTFSGIISTIGGSGNFVFSKQGIQTLTTNSTNLTMTLIINSGTGTLRLLSLIEANNSNAVTLTSGTLDLNNNLLNCGSSVPIFTISNNNLPRSIAFGTGSINLFGANTSATLWSAQTLTNFTLTGTPTVNLAAASTSGTRTVSHGPTGVTEANAISVNVIAGSSAASISLQGGFRNIDLTGYAASFNTDSRTIYGSLLISTGTTIVGGTNTTTFAGTSVVQDLTSNGKTLDFPITIGGTGNTLRLLDAFNQSAGRAFIILIGTTFNANSFSASVGALTINSTTSTPNIINLISNTLTAQSVAQSGSSFIMSASLKVNVTGAYNLTGNSVLDLGNQSVSFGSFASATTTTRTLNLGSGTLTITGSGSAFSMSSGTFILNAGTSTINFTNASAKTMSSISALTYYNVNQGGAGALTLQASNCFFNTISNSVQPTTILFSSTNTLTVTNLNLNGTAGNLVTLGPSSAASAYTVDYAGSTVNTMDYVSVSYFIGGRAGTFFATNSTNTAGNVNITFAAADTTPRYWVLGTGTWTNTATANWASSSGGAGGASAPTIETNVFFDANSNVGTGAFTVTITGTLTSSTVCDDLTISGLDGTLTWAGTGTLHLYGSALFPVTNFSRTYSGQYNFRSTTTGKTITSNGQQIANTTTIFNGIGGGWVLQDAFNIGSGSISVINGSLDTNGFAVAAGTFSSSNSNVRSISFGASTVTVAGTPIDFSTSTNLTFNAGTSSIVSNTSAGVTFAGGGQTFYNFSNTTGSASTLTISGANTFNNFSITVNNTSSFRPVQFSADQIINGTLTCSGSAANVRGFLSSNAIGTVRTLTVATLAANNCDFRDITIAGAAAGSAPTAGGDCGGNTGIVFPAAKTVYWNLSASQSWGNVGWATTPSGTPAAANHPLPQDTATFTDSGAAFSVSIGLQNVGTIDASTRTLALSLAYNNNANIYGSYTLGSGLSTTGGSGQTFAGRGTMVLTSAGKIISFGIVVDCVTGTLQLGDALTTLSNMAINSGNFNSASQTISMTAINSSGSRVRSITFGTSTINLSTSLSTPFDFTSPTNLTFSGASSTVNFTHNTGNSTTFAGGGLTYGTFNIGGTSGSGAYPLTGNGTTFNNITKTKPVAFTLFIPASTTINFNNFNVSGTAGNLVTLGGVSGGSTGLFNYTGTGVVSVDYVSAGINNQFRPAPSTSGATPYSWYLGANSVNNSSGANVGTLGAAFIDGSRRAYLLTSLAGALSWTVPDNWDASNNTLHLLGAGGNGVQSNASGSNQAAGGGGGGGGYTRLTNLSLSPGAILPFSIGNSGASTGKSFDTYINTQYLAGGGQAGVSNQSIPTSSGGAGGIGATYNGGNGAAGGFSTVASTGLFGGAGGGAGGPNGNGGDGATGFNSTTQALVAGGGGGGNGGGSNGTNGTSGLGGTGGNNFAGTGGGAPNTSGTFGGGGGGGSSSFGGVGGSGLDIENTIGGGGGFGGSAGSPLSNTSFFGSGGAGGGLTIPNGVQGGAVGTPGAIFIVYTPLSGFFAFITEAFTIADTSSIASTFAVAASENATLADTPTANAAFNSNVTEPITVEDTESVVASFIGVITENTQIADTSSAVAAFAAAIVEAATLADADSVLLIHNTEISEAITLDNSQTVIANFVSVVFENVDLADSQSVVANFAVVITEDTNLQDLPAATAAFVASLAEAITVEDSSIGIKIHNSDITENVTLADTETVIAAFTGLVSENINPADAPTVIASFNSQIAENLVLLDEPFPRGWYAINDEQTTVWTKVNNSYP